MVGPGVINKHQAFDVTDSSNAVVRIHSFSNAILTNSDRLTLNAFRHFITSMTTLLRKSSPASSRKVRAAFRFLRNGIVVKDSEENRFSAYWSALESLTKGVSSDNLDHDDHVVFPPPSCMGFDYVIKQLISIRGMSKTLDIEVQYNGVQLAPANLSLQEIYQYIKDPAFLLTLQLSFHDYPYAFYTINKFAQICHNNRILAVKILSHSDKVKRHIFRLYILRNAIAHNAESNPYISCLTDNLEHYLRGTISAIFIPHP